MEQLSYTFTVPAAVRGTRAQAIVGVVASGSLEVLVERALPPDTCTVDIATAAHGFGEVWRAVIEDFVSQRPVGGLRITVNDGGARPDTVSLRLAQSVRLIEEPET
jgi:malonate decarboxylase delta subunit